MEPWISPTLTLLAGLVGGFFGSYVSKRGEIRAIHRELGKVVEQNAAITKVTEEIKASISTKAWARDIRKEAAFEALKALAKVDSDLSMFLATHIKRDGEFIIESPMRTDASNQFQADYDVFVRAYLLASVACGQDIIEEMGRIRIQIMDVVSDILAEKLAGIGNKTSTLTVRIMLLVQHMRNDLGLDG